MVEDEIAVLIARSKAGDKAANATLLACYRPLLAALVARWASEVTPGILERDDLWQEAYSGFLDLVRSYQAGSAVSLGAYLKHSLGWRIANYVRAERRRGRLSEALRPEHFELFHHEMRPNVGHDWESPRLRAAFRKLSPRQRSVIVRFYVQERAAADVAGALGLSPKAARAVCRRAEVKLWRNMTD